MILPNLLLASLVAFAAEGDNSATDKLIELKPGHQFSEEEYQSQVLLGISDCAGFMTRTVLEKMTKQTEPLLPCTPGAGLPTVTPPGTPIPSATDRFTCGPVGGNHADLQFINRQIPVSPRASYYDDYDDEDWSPSGQASTVRGRVEPAAYTFHFIRPNGPVTGSPFASGPSFTRMTVKPFVALEFTLNENPSVTPLGKKLRNNPIYSNVVLRVPEYESPGPFLINATTGNKTAFRLELDEYLGCIQSYIKK